VVITKATRRHETENVYYNPLKPKLVQIMFNNSVRTAKKTRHFTITKISWLTLFKEIIAVYSENYTKPVSIKCRVTDCWTRRDIQLPLGFKVRLKYSKAVLLYLLAIALLAHQRLLVVAHRVSRAPTQHVVPVTGTRLSPEARFRSHGLCEVHRREEMAAERHICNGLPHHRSKSYCSE
jgi:hypothetical protein